MKYPRYKVITKLCDLIIPYDINLQNATEEKIQEKIGQIVSQIKWIIQERLKIDTPTL